MIYLLVCHEVYDIKSAKINISSEDNDDLSGVADFLGNDVVVRTLLQDGCINGLIVILRYIHFFNSSIRLSLKIIDKILEHIKLYHRRSLYTY